MPPLSSNSPFGRGCVTTAAKSAHQALWGRGMVMNSGAFGLLAPAQGSHQGCGLRLKGSLGREEAAGHPLKVPVGRGDHPTSALRQAAGRASRGEVELTFF